MEIPMKKFIIENILVKAETAADAVKEIARAKYYADYALANHKVTKETYDAVVRHLVNSGCNYGVARGSLSEFPSSVQTKDGILHFISNSWRRQPEPVNADVIEHSYRYTETYPSNSVNYYNNKWRKNDNSDCIVAIVGPRHIAIIDA